jgi:hypothetical protein
LTPEEQARRAAIVADAGRFEALLEDALRVEPPMPRGRRGPALLPLAAAAALVLAASAWLGLRIQDPNVAGSLGEELVAHILHEPQALVVAAESVPQARVDAVLQRAGATLKRPVGLVTYAILCPFRGRMVAHFVVQGERSPVTVMLLPDEHVATAMPVREGDFIGTVMPIQGGGSVAIVGQPDEDLAQIRDRVVEAVRWKL